MDKDISVTLKVWRQRGPKEKGQFETYKIEKINQSVSFLEMLDILNEQLVNEGKEPIVFDHDCREGICGMCSLYVNGHPHGPATGATTCQLYMRRFHDGETITIEPWRSAGFPVIRDLMVDRYAYDKIIQAGGFTSVNTGGVPDANAIPIPKKDADLAMDAALVSVVALVLPLVRMVPLCYSYPLRLASWLCCLKVKSRLLAVPKLWSLKWMSLASVTVRTHVLARWNVRRISPLATSLV